MRLFYRELGNGYPLVILHGLYGSSDNWMSIARELAQYHRVILVDQRNHGRSPHSPNHTYPKMASDLLELINGLNLRKVNLLGHSMGGKTAMLFAAVNPQMVKGLVAVDISPTGYEASSENSNSYWGHRKIIAALQLLDLQQASTRQQLDERLASSIPDIRVRQFLLKNIKRDGKGRFNWTLNVEAISQNLPAMMEGVFGEDDNIAVSTPTLFVKGEKSNYITSRDEMYIKVWFSNYRIEAVPNAGHWVHAEAPKALIHIANSFFESL